MEDEVWKPHVTVAAIAEDNGRFLMVEELSRGKVVLNQPAGHLDPGENLIEAVIRETLEETAWHFQPESVVGIYLWNHPEKDITFLRVNFFGQCLRHEPERTLDDGILRALWMTPDELKAASSHLRSEMVLRCIQDYQSGQRYPLEMLTDLLHTPQALKHGT